MISMPGQRRSVRMIAVVALVVIFANPVAAQEAPKPSGAREQLAQQVEEQLATNEALKARIAKLEAALQGDVCADQAGAEALLKEVGPAPAADAAPSPAAAAGASVP